MRFPALQSKQFVIYTSGNVFAVNAVWINRVIIAWLGWEITGLASWVGLLSFFLFAPAIVSSPLFGVIIDRVDLRRAAIVSQSVLIATIALLLALQVTGYLTIWLLSLIALSVGFSSSADRTIRFVMVPRIVDRAALANAVAIHGINFNTARLTGPAVGGVLIDLAGTDITILINLLMILPFLTILFIVKLRDRDSPKPKDRSFFSELIDGARFAANHPTIRQAMFIAGVFSITVRGSVEIIPAIADGVFHRGPQGLGQMLAASGAGALCAAFVVAIRRFGPTEANVSIVAQLSVIGGIVCTAILGLTASWPIGMSMMFGLGFFSTIVAIDLQTTVQLSLDDTYRGRVMSLWVTLVIGGAAVSAIALGFFADIFGIPAALVGTSAACALIVAAGKLFSFIRRDTTRPIK